MPNTENKTAATASLQQQGAAPTTPAPQQTNAAVFSHFLDKHKKQLQAALPKHLTVERAVRVAQTAYSKTPKLQEIHPTKIFAAIIQCFQMGLEPDNGLGHAWLLPFGREVQLIVGYMGMNELAYRSGMIKSLHGDVVAAADTFDFCYGSNSFLKHKPALNGRGVINAETIVCAYAIAELVNGGSVFIVLDRDQINKAFQRSLSKSASSSPWKTDFDQMAIKTAYRRLFKKLPKSPEIAKALVLDALHEQGVAQSLTIADDGNIEHAAFEDAAIVND